MLCNEKFFSGTCGHPKCWMWFTMGRTRRFVRHGAAHPQILAMCAFHRNQNCSSKHCILLQVGMSRLLCECPRAWQFGCWQIAMDAVCKMLRDNKVTRGVLQSAALQSPFVDVLLAQNVGINMNGTEDDLDFDFVVSYNNSSFMALHNAAPDKAAADPLRVRLHPRSMMQVDVRIWEHDEGLCAQDVAEPTAFVVQKLQQASQQAPHLAPAIQALAQTYQLS